MTFPSYSDSNLGRFPKLFGGIFEPPSGDFDGTRTVIFSGKIRV